MFQSLIVGHITHADDVALVAVLVVGFMLGVAYAVRAIRGATRRK